MDEYTNEPQPWELVRYATAAIEYAMSDLQMSRYGDMPTEANRVLCEALTALRSYDPAKWNSPDH
jgi:hypothetical protein